MQPDDVIFAARGAVGDAELDRVHSQAFGGGSWNGDAVGGDAVRGDAVGGDAHEPVPWNARLERWSLTWITGRRRGELVAFVNVLGDGGAHAILMDTLVAPGLQRRGVGSRLVEAAAVEARRLGCEWLHADYEPHVAIFYETACRMQPTRAGLLRL